MDGEAEVLHRNCLHLLTEYNGPRGLLQEPPHPGPQVKGFPPLCYAAQPASMPWPESLRGSGLVMAPGAFQARMCHPRIRTQDTAGGKVWDCPCPKLSQKPTVCRRVEGGGGAFLHVAASRASLLLFPSPRTWVSGSEEENPWCLLCLEQPTGVLAAILIVHGGGRGRTHDALPDTASQPLLVTLDHPGSLHHLLPLTKIYNALWKYCF